jgi:hypothetical protein
MRTDAMKKKFVRILRIELEDMDEHLREMIDDFQAKYQSGQETEHVCMENLATLRNEACGVRHILRLLDTIDLNEFGDLDALIAGLRVRFHETVQRASLAMCACVRAGEKIDKVAAYMRLGDHP